MATTTCLPLTGSNEAVFDKVTAVRPQIVRALHWGFVALFLVAIGTGYTAFDFSLNMSIGMRDALFVIHRLSGLTAGLLMIFWAIFRLRAIIFAVPFVRRWSVAGAYHICFGLLCLSLPIFPWLARGLDGRNQELYSIFPTYNLVSAPTTLFAYWLFQQHKTMVNYILILLALHLAAVAYHQLIRKDDVLSEMLFGKSSEAKR